MDSNTIYLYRQHWHKIQELPLTLNHKVLDDPVEATSGVAKSETASGKSEEVVHSLGSCLSEQSEHDPPGRLTPDSNVEVHLMSHSCLPCLKIWDKTIVAMVMKQVPRHNQSCSLFISKSDVCKITKFWEKIISSFVQVF